MSNWWFDLFIDFKSKIADKKSKMAAIGHFKNWFSISLSRIWPTELIDIWVLGSRISNMTSIWWFDTPFYIVNNIKTMYLVDFFLQYYSQSESVYAPNSPSSYFWHHYLWVRDWRMERASYWLLLLIWICWFSKLALIIAILISGIIWMVRSGELAREGWKVWRTSRHLPFMISQPLLTGDGGSSILQYVMYSLFLSNDDGLYKKRYLKLFKMLFFNFNYYIESRY